MKDINGNEVSSSTHFLVMNEACDQCLFSKDRIVDGKRMKQLLTEIVREGKYFVCHKSTIAGYSDPTADDVCCHDFYENYPDISAAARFARHYGLIRFVEIKEEEEGD